MSGEFFPNVIKDGLSGVCGCGFFYVMQCFFGCSPGDFPSPGE